MSRKGPPKNEQATPTQVAYARKQWRKPWRKAKEGSKHMHHAPVSLSLSGTDTGNTDVSVKTTIELPGPSTLNDDGNLGQVRRFTTSNLEKPSVSSAAKAAFSAGTAIASATAAEIFNPQVTSSSSSTLHTGQSTGTPKRPEIRLKALEEEAVSAALAAAAATAAAAAERARIAAQAALAIQAEQEMEAVRAMQEAQIGREIAVEKEKASYGFRSALLPKRRRPKGRQQRTSGIQQQQLVQSVSDMVKREQREQRESLAPIHSRPPPPLVSPRFAARLHELVTTPDPLAIQYGKTKRASLIRSTAKPANLQLSPPPSTQSLGSRQQTGLHQKLKSAHSPPATSNSQPSPSSQSTYQTPRAPSTQSGSGSVPHAYSSPGQQSTEKTSSNHAPALPHQSATHPPHQPTNHAVSYHSQHPPNAHPPQQPTPSQSTRPATGLRSPGLPPVVPKTSSQQPRYSSSSSNVTTNNTAPAQFPGGASNNNQDRQSYQQPATTRRTPPPPSPPAPPSQPYQPPASHAYGTLPHKNVNNGLGQLNSTASTSSTNPVNPMPLVTLAMLPNTSSNPTQWTQRQNPEPPPAKGRSANPRPSSATRTSVGGVFRNTARNLGRTSVSTAGAPASAAQTAPPSERSKTDSWSTAKIAAPADDPTPTFTDNVLPPSDISENDSSWALAPPNIPSPQQLNWSNDWQNPKNFPPFNDRINDDVEQKEEPINWQQDPYCYNIDINSSAQSGPIGNSAFDFDQSGSLSSLPQPYIPTDSIASPRLETYWPRSNSERKSPSVHWDKTTFLGSPATGPRQINMQTPPLLAQSQRQTNQLLLASNWIPPQRPMGAGSWNQTFDGKDRGLADGSNLIDNSIQMSFQESYQQPFYQSFDSGQYQAPQQQHFPETVVEEVSIEEPISSD